MSEIEPDNLHTNPGFLKFIGRILDQESVTIKIKNFKHGAKIAKYIASLPKPDQDPQAEQPQSSPMMVEMAINELIINAIEHGLLKISYNDKTKLLQENRWDTYVADQLSKLPEDQFVTITCKLNKEANTMEINITDPGNAFNLNQDPQAVASGDPKSTDPNKQPVIPKHGRGIKLAKSVLGEDNVKYSGNSK